MSLPAIPDFDPAAVPIRHAATVMLVDDRPDLQVLMLRRSARQVFAADMWVYPGGAVDPADAEEAEPFCVGIDDVAASVRLGVPRGGLAFWVAAIRECFEEAGVLFALGSDGEPVRHDRGRAVELEAARQELNAHRVDFLDLVRQFGLVLDAGRLYYVGHWVTPFGSPRRFDTRFFLAGFPSGQIAKHDDTESVHHEWVAPGPAVTRWRADEMAMMSPTARMLMSLLPYPQSQAAVAAAAVDRPLRQVRVRRDDAGRYHILLPGEDGYDGGDPDAEFGWVGL